MSVNIGWPEGIILGFLGLNLLMAAILDGEPRTGKYKFSVTLVATACELGLLYLGGFFA